MNRKEILEKKIIEADEIEPTEVIEEPVPEPENKEVKEISVESIKEEVNRYIDTVIEGVEENGLNYSKPQIYLKLADVLKTIYGK